MSHHFDWREARTSKGDVFYEGDRDRAPRTAQIIALEPSENGGVVQYGVRVFRPGEKSSKAMATSLAEAKRKADRLLEALLRDYPDG